MISTMMSFIDDVFHHIAWVRSSSGENKLYLDGVLIGTSPTDPGTPVIDQNGLLFGQDQDVVDGRFESYQAFVSSYNQALSASDIYGIYDLEKRGILKCQVNGGVSPHGSTAFCFWHQGRSHRHHWDRFGDTSSDAQN